MIAILEITKKLYSLIFYITAWTEIQIKAKLSSILFFPFWSTQKWFSQKTKLSSVSFPPFRSRYKWIRNNLHKNEVLKKYQLTSLLANFSMIYGSIFEKNEEAKPEVPNVPSKALQLTIALQLQRSKVTSLWREVPVLAMLHQHENQFDLDDWISGRPNNLATVATFFGFSLCKLRSKDSWRKKEVTVKKFCLKNL